MKVTVDADQRALVSSSVALVRKAGVICLILLEFFDSRIVAVFLLHAHLSATSLHLLFLQIFCVF